MEQDKKIFNNVSLSHAGSTSGMYLSVPNLDCVVEVNNNRAEYFSDLSRKYKEEAKEFRDSAKMYAEQN